MAGDSWSGSFNIPASSLMSSTPMMSMFPMICPSLTLGIGRKHRFFPAFPAAATIDRIPETGLILPSSPSSPTRTLVSRIDWSTSPVAARTATAMGRSNPVPSFLISAGDRFTVIFLAGSRKPEFFRASASTTTGYPSTPKIPILCTLLNTLSPFLILISVFYSVFSFCVFILCWKYDAEPHRFIERS